jgi:ABC-type branched-subunit amino acid transport system substrate-binding protein
MSYERPERAPRGRLPRAVVALLASVLVATVAVACGGDDDAPRPTSSNVAHSNTADALLAIASSGSARVFLQEAVQQGIDKFLFADGLRSQSLFDALGAAKYEGTPGTITGAPDAAFDAAYQQRTGRPVDAVPHIREAYDAVYLVALAATAANSGSGADIRDNLRFVANPPGAIARYGSQEFARAVEVLRQGQDINYEGASGPVDLDVNGSLAAGLVEVWKIAGGRITTDRVAQADLAADNGVEIPAGDLKAAATGPAAALRIGVLTPLSGDAAGQPLLEAMQMAADEINAAGGVWGKDVQLAPADAPGVNDPAVAAATQLVADGSIPVIIDGFTSQSPTLAIEDRVSVSRGILQVSLTANTPATQNVKDEDLLFNVSVPYQAEAPVLAKLARDAGYNNVCTLYVDDPYGKTLSDAFATEFDKLGGFVPHQVPITPDQQSYVSELKTCAGK